MYTLNCKGKLLIIDKPLLMGIINVTPDSFYDGGMNDSLSSVITLAEKMVTDGADILDVGGQSTRPNSERIGIDEELKRVLPVIEALHHHFPQLVISVDTYHSKVAALAIAAGASIVNDVSAGNMDVAMISTVAALKVPYVCMHMKGTPDTMQKDPVYDDVVKDVLDFFIHKTDECKKAGIADVIIDPGFGFGKTTQHNFHLLKNLNIFSMLQKPILAGLSRKASIYKTLGVTAAEALNGTTVVNTMALMNGASILRVHDIKEAKQAIKLFTEYR
ncbi:MAG TPA: dihydropteroate synthase [Ferruginibacter sp.]|jgi:dihydropteroate synthase|nr:dihydropteroate synthase [Ferruginibacter sp.]